MLKNADMENSEIVDPKTGKIVFVSTTVRIMFRKTFGGKYADMRNPRLNVVIAKIFADNSENVRHYFRLGSKTGEDKGVAEIRKGPSGSYFISLLKEKSVNIMTIQADWIKPKYKGSDSSPMEFDEQGMML